MVNNGWQWLTMVDNGWQWLTMVDHGGQWLAMVDNGWQWWTMVGNDGQWLKMVDKGWPWLALVDNGWQLLTMVDNGWQWLRCLNKSLRRRVQEIEKWDRVILFKIKVPPPSMVWLNVINIYDRAGFSPVIILMCLLTGGPLGFYPVDNGLGSPHRGRRDLKRGEMGGWETYKKAHY